MLAHQQGLWIIVIFVVLIIIVNTTFILIKRKINKITGKSNVVDVKCYVVLNETGNIIIKTNQDPSEKLPDNLIRIFMEAVSCLCMMTKTISTTIDPNTGKFFSIYEHPLFLLLSKESCAYKIKHEQDFADKPSNDHLGCNTPPDVKRKIRSIYSNMYMASKRIKKEEGQSGNSRLGHLTLCCESLLGIPSISVVMIHVSRTECEKIPLKQNKNWWDVSSEVVEFRKDTYLFNSPSLFLDYDNSFPSN
jgi:hypothetical protein